MFEMWHEEVRPVLEQISMQIHLLRCEGVQRHLGQQLNERHELIRFVQVHRDAFLHMLEHRDLKS